MTYSKSRFAFGREAAEPNRDLNGSGSMPPPARAHWSPPHAEWEKGYRTRHVSATQVDTVCPS